MTELAELHDEMKGYLNLGRMLIITMLRDSYHPWEKVRKEAYSFLSTNLCQLICEAIGLHHDDLCDMMGNEEHIEHVLQQHKKRMADNEENR